MPSFGPTSRRDLIRNLKDLGFDGPYSGGNHQYMVRGQTTPEDSEPASGRYRSRAPGQNIASGGYRKRRVGRALDTTPEASPGNRFVYLAHEPGKRAHGM